MGGTICIQEHQKIDIHKNKHGKVSYHAISEDRYLVEFTNYEEKKVSKQNKYSKRLSHKFGKNDDVGASYASTGFHAHNDSTQDQTNKFTNLVMGSHKLANELADNNLGEFDDWGIISDPKSEVKIKSISFYANYYICAIDIVYVEGDLKEVQSTHTANDRYLVDRSDIEKVTLNLERDEYITSISYGYSSQNHYIRSIQVLTTEGQLMVLEGQVELNHMNSDNSNYSSLLTGIGQEKERPSTSTLPFDQKQVNCNTNTIISAKQRVAKSDDIVSFSSQSKGMREMSVLKPHEKIISLSLEKNKQRVVGFKTLFGKYLRAIELYTESSH